MKKFNRLLSMLLVIVMLAGLVTISASAAATGTFTVTVKDTNDAPVVGVTVTLKKNDAGAPDSWDFVTTATTGNDGVATFTGISANTNDRFIVEADGATSRTANSGHQVTGAKGTATVTNGSGTFSANFILVVTSTDNSEQPGGEQPGGEQPGGEQPGGEQPGGEQPGGEQPGGEQPGGEQPGGTTQPATRTITIKTVDEAGNAVGNVPVQIMSNTKETGTIADHIVLGSVTTGSNGVVVINDRFADVENNDNIYAVVIGTVNDGVSFDWATDHDTTLVRSVVPGTNTAVEKDTNNTTDPNEYVLVKADKTQSFDATITLKVKQVTEKPSVVEPKAAKYFINHYVQQNDGSYNIKETEVGPTTELGVEVSALAKYYAGYHTNEAKSTFTGTVKMDTTKTKPEEIFLSLDIYYDLNATVSLSSIVDKRLVLKDSLPFRFEETFNAVVYAQSNPNAKRPGGMPGPGVRPGMMPGRPYPDGYVNYRNLEYVATLEVSVAKMKNDPFFKYPMYYRIPDFRWNKTLTKDFTPVAGSDITALTFTEPGTYTYFVKELAGKTRFMSYDTEWKKVVISVTEVDGVLKASVKTAVITNVYDKSANFDADANSSVTLTKVDSVDKTKVLQGAKFKLYQEGKYKDYEYYNTYTTNYNGEIEIYNLAAGDYYFVEVSAPVGYELDDTKIEFTIGKTSKTNDVELTVTNKKINIFTEEHFAYIQGYEDGTVRPQNNITRAEAATILFRLLDDGVRSKYWDTASSYADVSPAAWYNNAVATLENMGVLEVGANYRPNDYITRAELAFMITNFYDMAALDIEGIALNDIAGHVYETAIKQAAAMGWVKGYTDGSFNPNACITRAEAMTLINRVLERAVEERGMCAGMKTFPDNPVSAWYYEDVQEATNSHTYTRSTTLVAGYDFYYETWGSIQANPDWTALETTWAR